MDNHFALAIALDWVREPPHDRRVRQQHLFPLGSSASSLREGAEIFLKLRQADSALHLETAQIVQVKTEFFIRSSKLCDYALSLEADFPYIILFFENSPTAARCIVAPSGNELFDVLSSDDRPVRLEAFDLPPISCTVVDVEDVYTLMYSLLAAGDNELFGTNAEQFIKAPHILIPLFAHVLSLSSAENIDFPLLLRTVSEQLRSLLLEAKTGPRIHKIKREHASFWSGLIGERVGFADGGVARISGVPSSEPQALRVGIYSVVPGETDLQKREDWLLRPYVLGDLVCECQTTEEPDRKRLQEAARYVLEPLTALRYLKERGDVAYMFLHGPLVNQFTQYDESQPNFIPCLTPEFLANNGITRSSTEAILHGIPQNSHGTLLWNQFMAVYGVVMLEVFKTNVPVIGVVERTAGKWLSYTVLDKLVEGQRITAKHAQKLREVIDKYDISDDFLFGCVLQEGEYLEPMPISKNKISRARDRWQEVVGQYPSPFATVIKTSTTTFPFRLEMNKAAMDSHSEVLRLLYHTSRLLPRYAFPVGLDIVDKYAKVPDWLSRGVSGRIAADVLLRALRTGDPNMVAQVRQFLAHTPRDFFFRPQA